MTLFAPDLLRNFALGFGAGALILGVAGLAQDPSSPTSTTQASLTPAPPPVLEPTPMTTFECDGDGVTW